MKMQFPFLFFVGYAEGSAEGVHRQHYLLLRLEAVPSEAGAQSCTPSQGSSFWIRIRDGFVTDLYYWIPGPYLFLSVLPWCQQKKVFFFLLSACIFNSVFISRFLHLLLTRIHAKNYESGMSKKFLCTKLGTRVVTRLLQYYEIHILFKVRKYITSWL